MLVDDLSGVLDNGVLGDAVASAGQVSVVDGLLTWWGALPLDPTEPVTVSYTVTVGFEGDAAMDNIASSLTGTDDDGNPTTAPPPTCRRSARTGCRCVPRHAPRC